MAVTADEILAIIAEESGLDPARLRPEATLAELDISSLDMVSALFAIEDKLGIEVEPDQIPPDATVAQLTELVLGLAAR